MRAQTNHLTTVLEAIPDPAAVRQRLAHALREVDLLRRLLRLAVRKERELKAEAPPGLPPPTA
jgi:hypothetical protein